MKNCAKQMSKFMGKNPSDKNCPKTIFNFRFFCQFCSSMLFVNVRTYFYYTC